MVWQIFIWKLDYFEIFIGFIKMFKFIIYDPSHFVFFSFSFFWVNDLNLCSRLHCIVIDYKYFLHGPPVNSDYHNWVLSKFSYKHSLSFCIIMCMFVFFVLIIILVWLLRKCRDKFLDFYLVCLGFKHLYIVVWDSV